MRRFLLLLMLSSAVSAAPLSDYPGSPSEHGSVRVQISVAADGHLTGCSVVRPSNVASLDSATCPLVLQAARFSPSTDKDGKPAESTSLLTIHYVVPHAGETEADLPIGDHEPVMLYSPSRDAAQRASGVVGTGQAKALERLPIHTTPAYPSEALAHSQQGRVSVVIEVDSTGKPAGCGVVRTSHHASLDNATCKFALDNFRYRPAKDYFGRPIADVELFTATWTLPH